MPLWCIYYQRRIHPFNWCHVYVSFLTGALSSKLLLLVNVVVKIKRGRKPGSGRENWVEGQLSEKNIYVLRVSRGEEAGPQIDRQTRHWRRSLVTFYSPSLAKKEGKCEEEERIVSPTSASWRLVAQRFLNCMLAHTDLACQLYLYTWVAVFHSISKRRGEKGRKGEGEKKRGNYSNSIERTSNNWDNFLLSLSADTAAIVSKNYFQPKQQLPHTTHANSSSRGERNSVTRKRTNQTSCVCETCPSILLYII